jgi:hypothetical protein
MSVAPHHQRAIPGPRDDRFAVEWALPDDEIGPADVVLRVCDTDVQPGDSFCAHCPVCDNHQRMQSAVTANATTGASAVAGCATSTATWVGWSVHAS